ncbi:MAG: rhomboid family intramembrane serine protease [Saprospiraceae bacterium]|nr:rhomboid family intramembrane serine protease [Bacteroidia bacterium]NNE16772.1 rhomboid family intramembrane serine protease [Saprospiraceae bacterium]NNL92313.1 rhomboid family intramembrane serine protease [Saprospiraceae bacterium]
MFKSILEDIKEVFRSGNMLSKIIIVNIVVFVIVSLLSAFDPGGNASSSFSNVLVYKLSILSSPSLLIKQFWSILTHMFLHEGLRHIFWNMLLLYWFGSIVGDFLNDRRILPLYILGGLSGGFAFIIFDLYFPQGTGGAAYAMGASAAVTCMLMVAARTSPDYNLNLLLIGTVKLKYVAIFVLFIDLITIGQGTNSGGAAGHIGGAIFGSLYVYFLQKGTDLTDPLQRLFSRFSGDYIPKRKMTPRSTFTVFKNDGKSDSKSSKKGSKSGFSKQEELDRILDKINDKGYDKLTAEEKEFLYQASKKK